MKQKVLITFLSASFVALVMFSCKKKVEATIPEAYSEFAFGDAQARAFYVLSTSPGDTYKIPVGITTPLTKDVTINFSYTSATAVAGTHYTAPASITIPAGKVVDTLQLKGIFANIPSGTAYTVVAKISGGDLPAVVGRDSVVITLRRYCNVNVAALAGNYTTVETSPYYGVSSPYTSSVSGVVQTSATTATGVMNNVYGSGFTANVIFDWTDPANFKVILNPGTQQTTFFYNGTDPTYLTQASGTSNSFSSCANTITMNFRFYTALGTFDIWRADMTHQ